MKNKEIEIKLYVPNIPNLSWFKLQNQIYIEQAYLSTSPTEIRIRKRYQILNNLTQYKLEEKSIDANLERDEESIDISETLYNSLNKAKDKIMGNRIHKIVSVYKSSLYFGGRDIEIHIFLGKLFPLNLIEIEFDNKDEVYSFHDNYRYDLIRFFPEYKNVSLEDKFKNRNLALLDNISELINNL